MANSISSEPVRAPSPQRDGLVVRKVSRALGLLSQLAKKPNWFVRLFRAVFGYRKTTLTFLVLVTLLSTVLVSYFDNSLEYSVDMPRSEREKATLDYSWSVLQEIGRNEHTYTSKHNDEVHDYLELQIKSLVKAVPYAEYDNDLNYTNNLMFQVKYLSYDSVSYYESNNLLVRVNGLDSTLPALLLSSHFDSVPTSYGITDDGMGVASMMGVLRQLCSKDSKQPRRTIIFNFNNNEEFGLYGAKAFLSHPWAKQVKYFLNLEGTGAGGKAVLFRGTDYGIVNHFSSVRYPYANSFFQQGFNNHLIASETDYAVYKDIGNLRGLDLAFFKPRDIYHTAGDSIKNTNARSLWHMLSSTLDFTKHISAAKIDLDGEDSDASKDFASYFSFMNLFFSVPISQVVIINIVFLVVVPIVILFLLTVVVHYKKGWDVNLLNVVKFPLSFLISLTLLSFGTDVVLVPFNPFVANNSVEMLILALFSVFMLLNYCFLNLFNLVFKPFKGHQHDEKLVLLLESTLLSWIVVLWSTVKLAHNRIGDDHTGEGLLVILFGAQAVASIFGLIGWSFQRSKRSKPSRSGNNADYLPLLGSSSSAQYGAHDNTSIEDCSSLSLHSDDVECPTAHKKSFSYDWLIQFIVMVPASSFIIFNWGYLSIDGIHKSIQESSRMQGLIYKFIQLFVAAWALPFIPFVFKLNRSIVFIFIALAISGLLIVGTKTPFDTSNPLKLRFLQTIEIGSNSVQNLITVSGRLSDLTKEILSDIPSIKKSEHKVKEQEVGDGMLIYSWNSTLTPHVVPGVDSVKDYLQVEVLKNSSSSSDAPFGLLTGELRITAPKNRNCKLAFKNSHNSVKISSENPEENSPVRTAIVYNSKKPTNETYMSSGGIPEGFSKDHNGNYLFKSSKGIRELQLNKLDWDAPYHLSMQWVPEIVESSTALSRINVLKLGINIECYWSELGSVSDGKKNDFSVFETVPAYEELLHYSPNFVSWSNRDRGVVSVKRYIEI
ncbi:hypothetical protein PUMCH_002842 [Australozyma saopauloensis]|uniref:Peptide hydrolase n=1 Tax=Australozyma saopauloensis TaxID=291208 RepID=A0AAX4HAF0_9ASCO|nr:hypothetical protein PUMCH_002842 [[Candida] saopauloensis]